MNKNKIKYIESFGWIYLKEEERPFWKGSGSDMQFQYNNGFKYIMMIVDGNCHKKVFGETHIFCEKNKIFEGHIDTKLQFEVIMECVMYLKKEIERPTKMKLKKILEVIEALAELNHLPADDPRKIWKTEEERLSKICWYSRVGTKKTTDKDIIKKLKKDYKKINS